MVTGFYAALASAASVFIGILTALLASNLSNLNTQRERIERRIETIDARLENLDTQYEHFRNTLEEIREQEETTRRREQAQDQVDDFIEEYVGKEFDVNPDEFTPERLRYEFAQYIGVDEINQEQHEVLQERFEDVQDALTPSPGLMADVDYNLTDSSIIASNRQIEHQWQIHTEERYNRNYRRWIQTMTQIRSLQDERKRLLSRHESLNPSRIRESIRVAVVTIILSVGVPVFAYLLRVSNLVTYSSRQPWIEPTTVFIIWAVGLIYVFKHLSSQLTEDGGNIPNEPEIRLDEEISATDGETE